ncbi:MAG: hypothetical protein KJO87_09300, partial [Acidimicrobiia bacterium]|nr:hypothetical protein [Acidimicrobiia bacterium]
VVALAGLESEADVDVPTYPEIVFRPDGGSDALLAAVRASDALSQERDLAVTTVAFEPRVLSETEAGVGVVPYTDRLIVNITISNIGNEAAAAIPVRVVLSSDRTGTSAAESATIERLEPAESTSLEFVFAVVPVANYELLIDVGGTDGETSLDDNLLVLPFVVNEEG